MCKRNGNPRRKSRFICLRCMKENQLGDGIQRGKDNKDALLKVNKQMKDKDVSLKNLEMQSPDTLTELIDFAKLQLA